MIQLQPRVVCGRKPRTTKRILRNTFITIGVLFALPRVLVAGTSNGFSQGTLGLIANLRTETPTAVGPVLIGAQPQDTSVMSGTSATFTANAVGTAPITFQWNKNGLPIGGATSASYTTPPTTNGDNGANFTVTVANSVNSFTSAPATLSVSSTAIAPTIAVQPATISVEQGSTASFYVIATGTAPLSYQWQKNGVPIANAIHATYTTPDTTSADNNAQFTVTVTNSAGGVTSSAATLAISSTVYGLGGFQPSLPGSVNDVTGVRFRFQVVLNQDQGGKIIFDNHTFTTPGSTIFYNIEDNVYGWGLAYANGSCTTYPPLGTTTQAEASLRNATPDYPYGSGQQPAIGSAINTGDPVDWPVQTYLIDNIHNLYKSDSISQFSLNGLETLVTIQRAGTLTDISGFQRCGLGMLSTTYRMWTITTQVTGHPAVVNQVVLPDADARYILTYAALQFYSEFLYNAGNFAVQYWDFAYMRESDPVWTPISTFTTNWNYDGNGQDFGEHVVSVYGGDRIEFSNIPGNSYLPGNLPFAANFAATTPTVTSYLGNISTRGFVQTADKVMIGGFIVQGSQAKRVIIRAIGPELTPFGVPDVLADPTLELHNGAGALIASNNNWQTTIIGGIITADQVSAIQNSGHAPTDSSESAIIATLPPGNYTAIVRGMNNTTGNALVEVYDLQPVF